MSTDTVPIERAKPNWSAKDESKIRRVFEQCDEDSSGTVSLAELFSGLAKDKQLSRMLGIPPDASVDNKEQLEAIFAGLDTDGNAELDFEEFGYFFAERVEVLRYLPTTDGDATQCVLEADLEQIVRQKQPEVVPAFETCIAAELAAAGVTAGSEIYAELKGTAYTNVSKFVDAYSEPSKILPAMKQYGAELASQKCDLRVVKAHYDAFPKALKVVAPEWTVASETAWTNLLANGFDMIKLGFQAAAAAAKEAAEAAAVAEAAKATEADAAKKAAEEAKKAAEAEAKKAEEDAKAAEKLAKAATDDEAKAAAEAAAAAAEEAKAAAADAKAKAETDKAAAEAAKKAAEEAKKLAETEAKQKQAEVDAANAERLKEDELRNAAREKAAAEKAKADAAKSDEEKEAARIKALEAKLAAETAKQARQAREQEELKKEEAAAAAPMCGVPVPAGCVIM